MRTRPPSPSRSGPLRVDVFGCDGLRRQRLEILSQRSALVFRFRDAPPPSDDADAVVAPVRALEELALGRTVLPGAVADAAQAREPALLAFGPAECLRAAFLAGCDDYLREPWEPDELEARLSRVAGRRASRPLAMGGRCELDGRTVRFADGREVGLSVHQAVVAALLFANRGTVVSRRALALALWGRAVEGSSRAIDVHVSALRRKLGGGSISCVRGQGYLVD